MSGSFSPKGGGRRGGCGPGGRDAGARRDAEHGPTRARTAALDGLLTALSAREPAPAGGWAAAANVAMGAALAGMAARASTSQLADADLLARRTDRLRDRAAQLAEDDVAAYRKVLDSAKLRYSPDFAPWQARLASALQAAADIPLELTEVGAEVAELAARLAASGNPVTRADARVGLTLAEAGVRAAADLVATNVAAGGLDGALADAARDHARTAAELARDHSGSTCDPPDEPRRE